VGDEFVCCNPIPKEDVMTCVNDAKQKGYSIIVAGRKDVANWSPFLSFSDFYFILFSSSVQEATNGQEDDEQRYDVSPDVSNM